MLSNDPTFGAWLAERLWPDAGAGTKLAIAEAIAGNERVVPGHPALTLARRPECPPVVAQQLSRVGMGGFRVCAHRIDLMTPEQRVTLPL
ncbi:hypothetical protein [Micromonospora sp. NPDC049301]|uniref:hypothetical protein n=1 Tax=Micromonospora sp. NPDC049301 TaxID=3155723 RepID=UPI0034123C16